MKNNKNISISSVVFDNLLLNKECMEDTEQSISFVCDYNNYQLIFGGDVENNFELVLDTLGMKLGDKWLNMDCSDEQKKQLQDIVNNYDSSEDFVTETLTEVFKGFGESFKEAI